MRSVEFSKAKPCTKFQVCILSIFEDVFDCMEKNLVVT